MRRAAQPPSISPQLLKRFAAATIAITFALALFATEEEWGAQAQLEAVEAKSQLAAAEAAKLGTKKLEANLKLRNVTPGGGFGSDAGGVSGGGGGGGSGGDDGGGWAKSAPVSEPASEPASKNLPMPGPPGAAAREDQADARTPDPAKRKRKSAEKPVLSGEQLDKITANSRERSGSTTSSDD